ncbi:MAG: protein translocase subunit SecF [Cyanobacteriota bacterium]|nr:protein translocase subunit SecF [Cyanobacteriota bacterium]
MTAPSPRFRINRYRRLAWLGSALALALSVLGLVLCWLNPAIGAPLKPGLDFTGGTQIQVERVCASTCTPLSAFNVQQQIEGSTVQVLDGGRSLLVRLPAISPEEGQMVVARLNTSVGPLLPDKTSIDTIGPTLGEQLLRGSLISLLVSFAAIAAYITITYSGVFAGLALLCLAHDVLITCGVFAWLGLLRGVEVDSLFAVALITVAGYSVTDTVVIYDRIREQRRSLPELSVAEQVDVAVDATLTRSLYTSLTTLLPLIGLIIFGGSSLSWFAVALTVGIAVGSWSSIGVAPTLLPLLLRR